MRSLLFMPGNNEKILSKVEEVRADAVILDLEDGVPLDQKEKARRMVRERLETLDSNKLDKEVLVRVNGPGTGLGSEDCQAIIDQNFDGIMFPKVDRPEQIQHLEGILTGLADRDFTCGDEDIYLILNVETARGIINVHELLRASSAVAGAALGGEDLTLDIGARRTREGDELQYSRSRLMMAAKAERQLALDAVFVNIEDTEGLKEEAKKMSDLGFDGKLAIHPDQLDPINEAFTPAEEEIARARRIVEAFEEAEEEGRSVASVDGEMIDPPVAARARKLLELAEYL